jgi:hypothetical protein
MQRAKVTAATCDAPLQACERARVRSGPWTFTVDVIVKRALTHFERRVDHDAQNGAHRTRDSHVGILPPRLRAHCGMRERRKCAHSSRGSLTLPVAPRGNAAISRHFLRVLAVGWQ